MLKEALLRLRSELRYNAVGIFHPALPNRTLTYHKRLRRPVFFFSVMTRIKNEARFLPEFIAHHKLLGAEHFYFYDNNSNDAPEAVLRPFIDRCMVTIIPWKAVPASPSCYGHFFDRFASDSTWVAFIDADEFIIERQKGILLNALSTLDTPPALAINCRYFGSSFHERLPVGLLTNNFVRSDPSTNYHVKVIATPERVKAYYNSHNFIFNGLTSAVNYLGTPVRGTYAVNADQYDIEVSHYVYRSKDDYLSKLGLGFVDADGYKYRARRKDRMEAEFLAHNAYFNDWGRNTYGADIRNYMASIGYKEPYI